MSQRLEEIRQQTFRPVKKNGEQIVYGDWIVSDENYNYLISQAEQLEEAQAFIKKVVDYDWEITWKELISQARQLLGQQKEGGKE